MGFISGGYKMAPQSNMETVINSSMFTDIAINSMMDIPASLPDIYEIISKYLDSEILSVRILDTPRGVSAEGRRLSGKRACIMFRLKEKLLFTSKSENRSIHIIENESIHIENIIIPGFIEGTDPMHLINSGHMKANIEVNDFDVRLIDSRNIFLSIFLIVELRLVPTYELCCLYLSKTDRGTLVLSHGDGSHGIHILKNFITKGLKPRWSPLGNDIALLGEFNNAYGIYVYNLKCNSNKLVTDSGIHKSIGEFFWSADGKHILFSSLVKGNKNIFLLEIQSRSCTQLTFNNSMSQSHKPKFSPDGLSVAFLKTSSGITGIHIMDANGLNCNQVSASGLICDYSWTSDGKSIIYTIRKNSTCDELVFLDLNSGEEGIISSADSPFHIENIQVSRNGIYAALIGSNMNTDDLYIYNIKGSTLKRITKNPAYTNIQDFSWNADSTMLYFSKSSLNRRDIYKIDINTMKLQQVTNVVSTGAYVDYRPRIK
jgi:Tol biopolymer transport system component